jgi:hypothetical protein
VTVLEREPELWELARKIIAADLVRTQEWSTGDATTLQQLVAAYEAPGGKAAFERGLIPNGTGIMMLMSCTYKAEQGIVPPEWAIPKPLRDIQPSKLVFALPSPDDSLSEPALAKLRLMDTEMREALDFSWYSIVLLPQEAAYLACFIAGWDLGIIDAPFTAIPAPADLLSAENLELYEKFSDRSKSGFKRELANLILRGEVRFRRPLELEQRVSSFNSTPDEFLEGLRIWSDRSVTERACSAEQAACGGSLTITN